MSEKVKCWPGCMAMIIKAANFGCLVKVVARADDAIIPQLLEGAYWDTEVVNGAVQAKKLDGRDSICRPGDYLVVSDDVLMPITPDRDTRLLFDEENDHESRHGVRAYTVDQWADEFSRRLQREFDGFKDD